MQIRLLGTGGADGIPGFFANDEVSLYARKHGGKDVRTRSAALIDDSIKIDFGPDTFCQVQRDRIDPTLWTSVVFTHGHEDHFRAAEIQYALYPFNRELALGFTIFANEPICRTLRERFPSWPIELVQMEPFHTYRHISYDITTLRAFHDLREKCLNLIFDDGKKKILYATDTGVWDDETFEFLANRHLDCMVIECTEGLRRASYTGHLNIEDLSVVLERLHKQATISRGTRVITTHHAHTGLATHSSLEEALLPLGAEPGYDGMLVKV